MLHLRLGNTSLRSTHGRTYFEGGGGGGAACVLSLFHGCTSRRRVRTTYRAAHCALHFTNTLRSKYLFTCSVPSSSRRRFVLIGRTLDANTTIHTFHGINCHVTKRREMRLPPRSISVRCPSPALTSYVHYYYYYYTTLTRSLRGSETHRRRRRRRRRETRFSLYTHFYNTTYTRNSTL